MHASPKTLPYRSISSHVLVLSCVCVVFTAVLLLVTSLAHPQKVRTFCLIFHHSSIQISIIVSTQYSLPRPLTPRFEIPKYLAKIVSPGLGGCIVCMQPKGRVLIIHVCRFGRLLCTSAWYTSSIRWLKVKTPVGGMYFNSRQEMAPTSRVVQYLVLGRACGFNVRNFKAHDVRKCT